MKVTNYSLSKFIKEVVKEIMGTGTRAERDVFIEENAAWKNGFTKGILTL